MIQFAAKCFESEIKLNQIQQPIEMGKPIYLSLPNIDIEIRFVNLWMKERGG